MSTFPEKWVLGLGYGVVFTVRHDGKRFFGRLRMDACGSSDDCCQRGHKTPELAARHGTRRVAELTALVWREAPEGTYGHEVMAALQSDGQERTP